MGEHTLPFTVRVDQADAESWDALLPGFADATLYQTSAYGAARWGANRLSRLTLHRCSEIVAVAQAAVVKLPLLPVGIAYVPWGPVVTRKGKATEPEVLRNTLKALRAEFVERRSLLLRLAPHVLEGDDAEDTWRDALQDCGFSIGGRQHRTWLVDLTCPEEELRSGMAKRWRRALKAAAKEGLDVQEGTGDDLYREFMTLYDEMVSRKKFIPGVDINEFRRVQRDLPPALKMKIMLCRRGPHVVAALIASLIANKGIGLIGATATDGLKSGGFHLLNWRMLQWMRGEGAAIYDFGGYSPETNAGTALFKAGLPGRDVRHIGTCEAAPNRLAAAAIRLVEKVRLRLRQRKWSGED